MRFRQVHLDFHTSGLIPEVGGKFDKVQFQNALKMGHVDSITVFSKCHHGYAYHPSKANIMHPTLTFDLLDAQLEACREIDVAAPVYLSAGLDEKEVLVHPEWLMVNPDEPIEANAFTQPRWHRLCFNTPYLEKLALQVEEVMERYHPCGIFLDFTTQPPCVCANCVRDMLNKGLNPDKAEDRVTHIEEVNARYAHRIEQAVRKYSATATIFHNNGHIVHGRRDIVGYNSHLELESLPTGGWGYDHFPMSAAYARTTGKEYLGMTGKFHTTWGEFGGFKHPNALIYETSLSLACGAGISIGDQLHPSARMNESTYALIGKAYELVEKKEPWCKGAKNISDIAVLSCEAVLGGRDHAANAGASRILLEGKHLFDFIDLEADFSNYKLLILPDKIILSEAMAARIEAYRAQGGKVLLTGDSGLNAEKTAFAFNVGAEYAGETASFPDYLIPDFETVNGSTEYVMYTRGNDLCHVTGEVLAHRQSSYFNRQGVRFCSHQHTPNNVDARHQPAAVLMANTAYIGWKVFEDYATKGALVLKELVLYAIDRLIGDERTIRAALPDRGVVTVTQQPGRRIVHLLFAHTCVRGKGIEVIEDAVPLHDVQVELRLSQAPSRVALAPEGDELSFSYEYGCVHFSVPVVNMHQMIEVLE